MSEFLKTFYCSPNLLYQGVITRTDIQESGQLAKKKKDYFWSKSSWQFLKAEEQHLFKLWNKINIFPVFKKINV